MTIATELARRIRAFTYDGLPDAALEWAKTGILDTVGVTLAGSAEPCAQIMLRVCTDTGPALVFGSAQRLSVTDAALVNGTASHALDFDDCSNTLGGHPSVPILPGLFALADAMPVSGRDFLAAYVAGFETETRIARAVNFHHYDKGWHPTATLGIFGATAAASRPLELTQDQTATALAIAASFSSGLKANFGTMTKPLHVGHCARNGVMAAMRARGYDGEPRCVRAPARLFQCLQRRRQLRCRRRAARLGGTARHHHAGHRHQELSVLRQHPSGHRRHARSGARASPDARECRSCGVLDASATSRAHQPSEPAQRARCEVQCAILPGPRAGGRPSGAVAFQRGRLSRRAGGGCDGPHRSGAASADVIRRHRAFRCRGDGHDHRRTTLGEGGGQRARTHVGTAAVPVCP